MSEITDTMPSYKPDAARWHLVNTLTGGTESMRKAGKALLPQEDGESDKAYDIRLKRSVFYNRFSKAVRETTGKLVAKGFQLSEDVTEEVATLLEDADVEGRDLNQFLSEVCEEAVAKGISYVLVEFPVTDRLMSRQEELAAGIRPYLVHIKPEQIFYWEAVRGKLVKLRFFEDVLEGTELIKQIRELTPTTWAVYRQNDKGEWAVASEGTMTLGEIPLVAFYSRRISFMSARPPLEDLMHLNICHWQSSSDQRHILHVARVPILFGTGLEDGVFELGPNRLVRADQGADLKFIEHGGQSITAGAEDLRSLEEQMETMSFAPILSAKPGVQTATAHSIDSAEAQSMLQLIRTAWEDAANLALYYFQRWRNQPVAGSIVLQLEDADKLSASEGVTELSKARMAGDISRQAYLAELKRRNILQESFDPEADAVLLNSEGAALGEMLPEE